MTDSINQKPSLKHRLVHELRNYLVISAYLFVCFAIILLYQASLLPDQSADAVGLGAALVKALVLGKFILIGEALKVGSRHNLAVVWHRVAWKTVALLVMLMVFNIIEEMVVGAFHGHGVGESLGEYFSRPAIQLAAPPLMMLLILIPMVAATELNRLLGAGGLLALLRSSVHEEENRG